MSLCICQMWTSPWCCETRWWMSVRLMPKPWTTCLDRLVYSCEPLSQACCIFLFMTACTSHPSSSVVFMQANESEISAPNKPLWQCCWSDLWRVPTAVCQEPCPPQLRHLSVSQTSAWQAQGSVEQQRQQLNSIYSLPSDGQHSPTNMWRVSTADLTTPP